MTEQAAAHRQPYMAAQSFGPADTDLFFGRDGEGISLARFIEDRPLSVLTAPSGIGKTSLLNAKVVPLLEKRGWITIASRPTEDPGSSIRHAICDHLIPDLADETRVVQGLAAELGPARTLGSAIAWHEDLRFKDRIKHRFFLPGPIPPFGAMPMISRALRGSISCEDLLEHYEAVASRGQFLGLSEETSLGDLVEQLGLEHLRESCELWRKLLVEAGGSLLETLRYVEDEWLALRPNAAGLLLIVDQFEEMFTVAGPAKATAWMSEFAEVADAQRSENGLRRPVRLTLSLRKEFLADLMPHLEPFGAAETLTFFLGSLNVSQARDALRCPVQKMGYRFVRRKPQESIVDRIIGHTEEVAIGPDEGGKGRTKARLFSPILISLLGAHLWKGLEREATEAEGPITYAIDLDRFERLVPSLENIFEAFLMEALEDLATSLGSKATRFDALELLDRLVTSGGFRNFVLEEHLVSRAPMPAGDARELIEQLDYRHRLIRRERRGKDVVFVEIMHEKLIEPVRTMLAGLRQHDQLRASLLAAKDMLRMLPEEVEPGKADALPAYFRDALQRYCDRLDPDLRSARILFRSLLIAGDRHKGDEWPEAVRRLARDMPSYKEAGSDRRPLRHGIRLDQELKAAKRRDATPSLDDWCLLARSALADTTAAAGQRIDRAMALRRKVSAA
jgi:hypothetical protein